MSFKAVITEKYTKMNGTVSNKLAGLSCYIRALRKAEISDYLIKRAIEIAYMSEEEIENSRKRNKAREKELDKKLEELMKKIFD